MRKTKLLLMALVLLNFMFCNLFSQDMEKSLFGEIDKMMEDATKDNLKILSPSIFDKALNDYQDAKSDFKDGANLKGIQEKINNVMGYLSSAREKAEVSKITLKNSIEARNDAIEVDAQNNAPELWKQAEEKFRDAGEEVEDGDIPDAEEASKEAEELFRSAELSSIKVLYLDETWKLINSAREADAENYTPKTLEAAISLVKNAEEELSQNRYDTDQPRNLAQQAKYEANHSLYLTNFIKKFEDSDESMESLLLTYEPAFQKIAEHFDYNVKFDRPISDVSNEIVQKVVELKTDYQHAQENIIDLKNEIKILNEQLGGLSKEKSELDARMAKLAEIKAKFEKLNNMFSSEEAMILKEGNNIIMRLMSLTFPVGKSTIEPENFALLSKVQNALKEFPNSSIVVEGHTDSYGSDEKNLELSTERATAVKQYLIANMNLDQAKVMAFGYGETKPIANNETKEGRAKNRRIDLIIQNAE